MTEHTDIEKTDGIIEYFNNSIYFSMYRENNKHYWETPYPFCKS